jgi:hypothetical protein
VGDALELRVDGTLASLHRPGSGLTGPVWWALAAPVLLTRPPRPRRVLLLGLAAGSVARALRAIDPGATLVGVEGYPLVARRLSRGGVFVSNTIHEFPAVVRAASVFGGRVVSLDVASHYNRIVLAGEAVPEPRALRRLLAADARLAPMLGRVSIRACGEPPGPTITAARKRSRSAGAPRPSARSPRP